VEPIERIDPPGWVAEPAVAAVLTALGADGAVVRFVGGCVRDTLLARPIGDIDIATPDPPDTVLTLLDVAAIKSVPTGIAHGTITAVLHR
jgi:poly(A) polymerase